MSALRAPLEGGCACGAVRYRISADPATLYACHCLTCQAQSGSAFNLSLRVTRDAFHLMRGEMASVPIPTDSGRAKAGHFCPRCGGRLIHVTEGVPHISVRAGTLDRRAELQPVGHIFVRSAQSWIRFPDDVLVYQGAPADGQAALIERWRQRMAEPPKGGAPS